MILGKPTSTCANCGKLIYQDGDRWWHPIGGQTMTGDFGIGIADCTEDRSDDGPKATPRPVPDPSTLPTVIMPPSGHLIIGDMTALIEHYGGLNVITAEVARTWHTDERDGRTIVVADGLGPLGPLAVHETSNTTGE